MRNRIPAFLLTIILVYALLLTASQDKSALVHRTEILPGELFVSVFEHKIPTSGRSVSCWTFVTEGLERCGQHEIVFSLRRPRGKNWEDFSRELFTLFERILGLAEQGMRYKAYDGYRFADDETFLGQAGPSGLIFVPAEMFDGVDVPFEALAAVLIKGDEVEVMAKSSAIRIASMLAAESLYYPCPPWSDLSRKPVVSKKQFEKSILSRVAHLRVPGLTVRRAGTGELGLVSLRVEGAAAPDLGSLFAGFPAKGAVALLTNPDIDATMRYSWMPAAGKTGVIYAELGSLISGSFVILLFGEGLEDWEKVIEDGISLSLCPESWEKLKTSIISYQPARIPLGKNAFLTTDFIHTMTYDPLQPKTFLPVSVQLYQTHDELTARMGDESAMSIYVKQFEKAATACLADAGEEDARGVMIAVVVKPGKRTMVWCEAVGGSLSDDILKKLNDAFCALPAPDVREGPVAFMLKGTLRNGEVEKFPEFPKAWSEAIAASGRPFTSLDELVMIIWPDK